MYHIFYILFIFLVTENIYEDSISGLNYFDEVIAIVALCYLMLPHKKYYTHSSPEKKSILCIMGVLIIGCISTLVFHIQSDFGGIWRDVIAIMKFPICYYAFLQISYKYKKKYIQKSIIKFAQVYTFCIGLIGVLNFIKPIEVFTGGYRYGMPLYHFIYSHATFLISTLIILVSVLIANGVRKNKMPIILGIIGIILTFRSKPILIVVFISIMLILRNKNKLHSISKKQFITYGIIILALSLYFASSQINTYISFGESAARGAFYIYGFNIAYTRFPLGSGFCTFASTLSHKYYSPLYFDYNMQNIWGITPDDGSYAGDTFWPNIFAQYGFIGFILYLLMLFYIYKSINNRFIILSDQWIAAMSLLLYTISAAFAESFYTNATSVIFALVLSIYLGENSKQTLQTDHKNLGS